MNRLQHEQRPNSEQRYGYYTRSSYEQFVTHTNQHELESLVTANELSSHFSRRKQVSCADIGCGSGTLLKKVVEKLPSSPLVSR